MQPENGLQPPGERNEDAVPDSQNSTAEEAETLGGIPKELGRPRTGEENSVPYSDCKPLSETANGESVSGVFSTNTVPEHQPESSEGLGGHSQGLKTPAEAEVESETSCQSTILGNAAAVSNGTGINSEASSAAVAALQDSEERISKDEGQAAAKDEAEKAMRAAKAAERRLQKAAAKAEKKAVKRRQAEQKRAALVELENATLELEKLPPAELTSTMEGVCAAFATEWETAKNWDQGTVEQLNSAMQALASTQVLTPEEHVRRLYVIERVRKAVMRAFPQQTGLRVVPYGSFVSGIGSHASDLDLSIEGTWRNGPDATPKQLSALSPEKRVSILRDMIGALRVSKTSKGYIEKVLHARVPVLKFVEATTGISCDLCLSNTTAVEKSAVLQWISEIDGRFVQLMSLVKLWAKAHGINDPTSGSFNGFALALMVMFHLQTLKVPMLPPLCEIFGGASDTFVDRPLAKEPGPETVQAFARARELAARYRDGRYGCCQLASVVELFAGFVVHMNAAFKWWLQGGTSHVRLSAWAGGWTVHGWSKSYAVAVEDPFDASENCARAIGRRNQERFKIHEAILQVMKVTSEAMSSITSETCLGDLIRALFGDKSLGLLPPELRNELKTGGPKICRWPDMPKQRVGLKPGDPEPPPSRNGAKGAKRRPSAAARKAQGNGKDSGGQGQSRNRASGEANGVGSKDSGKEQKADAQGDAAAEPPAVPDPIAEPRGAPRQAKRWGDDDTSADNEDPPRALGAGNGVATGNPPSKDKRLQAGAAEDVAAPREAAARSRWKKGQRDRKKSAETEHRREEPQSEAGVAAGTGNSLVPGAPHEAAAEAGAAAPPQPRRRKKKGNARREDGGDALAAAASSRAASLPRRKKQKAGGSVVEGAKDVQTAAGPRAVPVPGSVQNGAGGYFPGAEMALAGSGGDTPAAVPAPGSTGAAELPRRGFPQGPRRRSAGHEEEAHHQTPTADRAVHVLEVVRPKGKGALEPHGAVREGTDAPMRLSERGSRGHSARGAHGRRKNRGGGDAFTPVPAPGEAEMMYVHGNKGADMAGGFGKADRAVKRGRPQGRGRGRGRRGRMGGPSPPAGEPLALPVAPQVQA